VSSKFYFGRYKLSGFKNAIKKRGGAPFRLIEQEVSKSGEEQPQSPRPAGWGLGTETFPYTDRARLGSKQMHPMQIAISRSPSRSQRKIFSALSQEHEPGEGLIFGSRLEVCGKIP
jgi:hypothetical protein